jgi:mRNA interferase MazF
VILPARTTRLPKDSVANVSQLFTLDRSVLQEHIVKLSPRRVEAILSGVDAVLGR